MNASRDCLIFPRDSGGFIPWDNPDNIISHESQKLVETAVSAILLPVLFLISCICNTLNLLIFWKQGLKERINLCLFYLSLLDFLHMLSNFVYNIDRLYLQFARLGPVLEFIIGHHLVGFFRSFNWLSGFMSMLIACERCLCVVSPLRSQTVLKTRTTAVILAMATVLIMVGSMMVGLRRGLVCVFDPATNTTFKTIYTSTFYKRNKDRLDVLTLFVFTLQPFTYVIVVMGTTIVTSVKLKQMVAWREQTASASLSWRQVALTRILVAVSVLYLLCSGPTIVTGALATFVPGIGLSGRYYNVSSLLISLLELGSFINATFNFCVYCFLGSKFRETLRAVLTCGTVQTPALHGTKRPL